jgi:hypothetical protein
VDKFGTFSSGNSFAGSPTIVDANAEQASPIANNGFKTMPDNAARSRVEVGTSNRSFGKVTRALVAEADNHSFRPLPVMR